MRRVWALGAVVATVAVVGSGCGNDTQVPAERSKVFRSVAEQVIVPAYEDLAASMAALESAVENLCARPDAAALTEARERWLDAWRSWSRTRAFRFGPLTETRNLTDIAFMVDPAKIDALIAGSDPSVGPPFTAESLAATGTDVRGLGAIEHVLFADAVGPEACSYASAAAEIVADNAEEARVAWVDGTDGAAPFAEQLAEPGGDSAYADGQAALDDLVNGVSMALTEATRELADAEAAAPGARESGTQHGGVRVRETLASVRSVYLGARDGSAPGIDDLVEGIAPESAERVRDFLARADAAVAGLPDSLDDASTGELRKAYLAARNAGTLVRAEVASELGVTLSLSDSDGDS